MNRFRFLVAAAVIALGSIASATEKIPTWLVGKYSGYSSYMKASFGVSISANGLVFGDTQIARKKMYHVNGRYHHNELIIGEKIYGINRRSDGIDLVNMGNPRDTINLKKTG